MRPSLRLALLTLTGVVAVGVALAIALTGSSGHPPNARSTGTETNSSGFDGARLPPTPPYDFTLTDQHGRRASLHDYRGKLVILTFLSTASKHTSPLMAQQIRGALDQLSDPPPALAVSIAPHSDTPAHIEAFLRRVSLTGRLEYLTGPASQLERIWHNYHITPPRPDQKGADRSAYVLLIDPHGVTAVSFPVEGLTPEGLAHDIRKLQAG